MQTSSDSGPQSPQQCQDGGGAGAEEWKGTQPECKVSSSGMVITFFN